MTRGGVTQTRLRDSDAVTKFTIIYPCNLHCCAKTCQIANTCSYRQDGPRCAHILTLRYDSPRAGVWTDAVQETSSQTSQTPNVVLQVMCLCVFYLTNLLKMSLKLTKFGQPLAGTPTNIKRVILYALSVL